MIRLNDYGRVSEDVRSLRERMVLWQDSGGALVAEGEVALAIAFDAFFTEARWQIATGRLPYWVGHEHAFAVAGPNKTPFLLTECAMGCGATRRPGTAPFPGGPCRAFHPRQP